MSVIIKNMCVIWMGKVDYIIY